MNLFKTIAAAGLAVVAVAGVSTSANAQNYRDHRHDRYDRYDRRHYGWDRGRHYGWNRHRVCRTHWRHHRPVTICRRVRWY